MVFTRIIGFWHVYRTQLIIVKCGAFRWQDHPCLLLYIHTNINCHYLVSVVSTLLQYIYKGKSTTHGIKDIALSIVRFNTHDKYNLFEDVKPSYRYISIFVKSTKECFLDSNWTVMIISNEVRLSRGNTVPLNYISWEKLWEGKHIKECSIQVCYCFRTMCLWTLRKWQWLQCTPSFFPFSNSYPTCVLTRSSKAATAMEAFGGNQMKTSLITGITKLEHCIHVFKSKEIEK